MSTIDMVIEALMKERFFLRTWNIDKTEERKEEETLYFIRGDYRSTCHYIPVCFKIKHRRDGITWLYCGIDGRINEEACNCTRGVNDYLDVIIKMLIDDINRDIILSFIHNIIELQNQGDQNHA